MSSFFVAAAPFFRFLTGLGFVNLLRLAWIAAILPILVSSLPVKPLQFLHRTLSSFAARGKTSSSSSLAVPQRFFLHFYVLAFALTTLLALAAWFYACGREDRLFPAGRTPFLLLLMECQVARRLYETLYVFRYGPSARMHVLGYLAGLFFYTVAPLSIGGTFAVDAVRYAGGQIGEFIVNGREQLPIFGLNCWEVLEPLANLGWCQWIGFGIFMWGWLHQLLCHAILGSLREDRRADEYVIPHGDWFEYVSCPHYFAEIVLKARVHVGEKALVVVF